MHLFVIAATILGGADSVVSPVASFAPGSGHGLRLVTVADGEWKLTAIAGREAATLTEPSTYLYFQVDPDLREQIGSEYYLVVEFLDTGIGLLRLQYDSVGHPYAQGPATPIANTGEWARALFHVTDASLTNRQNCGADFRFAFASSLAIARVDLYTEPPGVDVPPARERVQRALGKLGGHRPTDMFYTFGNDADDATAIMFRALGVTSIESYVTWETCEGKAEGEWDWSRWDEQVRILQENDLKWVPFLILGPAYSTPDWFRESDEHVPCACLEHGIESKIESLWNPHLPARIDRFLAAFAERYRDTGVVESVLLGIQGDFGEAIYSVSGGGWTFIIPGEYHNHAGFWCNDPHARADFRAFARQRHRRLRKLNHAWGTAYKSWDVVDFPGRQEAFTEFREQVKTGTPEMRRRWLDFVDWYRGAMTDFADWWMETTRKHFPDAPIYLCTGGHAPPEHGANFAEQCRVAAKHGAGVRITNEASNYPANFVITRWVAAAGRHYGAYFGFEPAGSEDEKGIVARIYNATASGANQLHDYNANVISSATRVDAQQTHLPYLFHVSEPIVPVALWYPNVSMTLDWGDFLGKARKLRDYTDFDYVDETLLRNGALDRYDVLLVIDGPVMETADAKAIASWVKKGGRLIVESVPSLESVEATDAPERALFRKSPSGRTLGKGAVRRVPDRDGLVTALREALLNAGHPVCDLRDDGIFCTRIPQDRLLVLNTTDEEATLDISCANGHTTGAAAPQTISEIALPTAP